jgi:hypothetical protein
MKNIMCISACRNAGVSVLFSLFVGCCLTARAASHTPPPAGVAPVAPPIGGFGIEGNLLANSPVANVGDWLRSTNASLPGTGGGVLDEAGMPLNPATTFHFIDPYGNDGNDSVFTGGHKWFDDPKTWEWTTGRSSSKTDINNVLLHITTDANGHVWAVIAADRLSTSGDSYIDFEFLQNSLTRTNDGKFASAGPDDGRTKDDLLLSLGFTSGGSTADFYAFRWQTNGSGGFAYIDLTAALPAGSVFVALNRNDMMVPYRAFGQTNYAPNAFAEAAVDLTALLSSFDPCMSIGVRSIMVKTKASQSDTATIEDFIDPIQYTLHIGPGADAGPDQVRCSEGDSTAFPLHGTASAGFFPIASTTWNVVAGTATIDSVTSLVTTAHLSSGTATLRLTVVQANGCTETDDVLLAVSPLPACSVAGPTTVCPNSHSQFQAPAGMTGYSWSIAGNGTISGPTNAQTITVNAGSACGQIFTLTLNTRGNGCLSVCRSEVLVNDSTPPTLSCPADLELQCPADTRTNATGIATAQDDCGVASISYSDAITNACAGTKIIARTWMATDLCGNQASCVQTITVIDTTPPVIACPPNTIVECPGSTEPNVTGNATATDACGSVRVGFNDEVGFGANCGIDHIVRTIRRTWTATDDCGNSSRCVQTITVKDTTAPVVTCPQNVVVECPGSTEPNVTGTATATEACGTAHISFDDEGSSGGNCAVDHIVRTIRRTWTATDDCGNSSSCVQTITVKDTTAPVITCPQNTIVECPGSTEPNVTGMATATEVCGTAHISFNDEVTSGANCAVDHVVRTIRRTWTATDDCGNSSSCVQTITVKDTTAPVITCPQNTIVECPGSTEPNVTGTATATEVCGTAHISFNDEVTSGANCAVDHIVRTIRRTWTATDDCGNSSSCVQTITLRDTTAPVITCPQNLVLECPADTRTNVAGMATGQDNCSTVAVRYSDVVSNSCGGAKVIARTWIATDECGNSASCVQSITVRDTIKPTITCPPDVALECSGDTSPSATGTAVAHDGCSSTAVRYADIVTPGCGGSKVITRTWTASDACGNSASCVQTIAVRDTTPPQIVCELINTYSQGGYGGGGEPGAILADNYLSVFPNGLMIGVFNPGNGNAAPNGLFWEPNAAGLSALQVCVSQGGGSGGPITRDVVNPTDNFGGGGLARQTITLTLNIAFNTAGVIGIGPNNFGSLIYTKSGDSLNGLTVKEILDVANHALAGLGLPAGYDFSSLSSLIDNLNVSFHSYSVSSWANAYLSTPMLVVQCASQVPLPDPSHVQASDSCSGPPTVTNLPDIITDMVCPNRYVITRRWVARDECGNTNMCTYNILVDDTTPPVLLCEPSHTAAPGVGWAFDEPTAADNCGVVTVQVLSTVTNLVAPSTWVATRTWEAVDECGNSSTCQQSITMGNMTAPVLQIQLLDSGKVKLSWAVSPIAYRLEACGAFGSSTWNPMMVTPVVINGMNTVELVPSLTQYYYRLTAPTQ